MQASTMTVDDALGLLPKVVRMRYSDSVFGVGKVNSIFSDIEKKCVVEYYKKEYPLVLLDGITDYEIDSGIRKIRGLFEVPAGEVVPDYRNPVSFSLRGNDIRLEKTPVVNDDDDISSTVTGASGTSRDRFADTVELGSSITENSLKSALCVYTDTSLSRTINRVVASNDPDNSLCLLNGVLPEVPDATDTYAIYKNYFMVDALRYITRATLTTSVLDIPIDMEELIISGLRYFYENQTDQESSKARNAGTEYSRQLRLFMVDELKKIGSNPKPVPRDIPDFGGYGTDNNNMHIIL